MDFFKFYRGLSMDETDAGVEGWMASRGEEDDNNDVKDNADEAADGGDGRGGGEDCWGDDLELSGTFAWLRGVWGKVRLVWCVVGFSTMFCSALFSSR